jgi:N-formylglutamate amidohydrolase
MNAPVVESRPDTDWDLPDIYEPILQNKYSSVEALMHRYVADLNRDPTGTALYSDNRFVSEVVPIKSFAEKSIYNSQPSKEERSKRIRSFFTAYHQNLESVLRSEGTKLLVDAHSISRKVPSLFDGDLPDLILGNGGDLETAPPKWLEKGAKILESHGFSVAINDPFRGGWITRSYPSKVAGLKTIQIEMCNDLYLREPANPVSGEWNEQRVQKLRLALQNLLDTWAQLVAEEKMESNLCLPPGTLSCFEDAFDKKLPRGFSPSALAGTDEQSFCPKAVEAASKLYKRGAPDAAPSAPTLATVESVSSIDSVQDALAEKFIVCDRLFYNIWKEKLSLPEERTYFLDASEANKSLGTASDIAGKGRQHSEWVAIGGGLTLDTVAFAASRLSTPIDLVPTTLLAVVDAGLGGKTGVNYSGSKNLIGSFYNARRILLNTDFLNTQSLYDYLNGASEALKMHLLQNNIDKLFWDRAVQRSISDEELIELGSMKLSFVGSDFTEKGKRALLNFGHTFGHLIESTSIKADRPIGHGAAVLLGMYLESVFRGFDTKSKVLESAIIERCRVDQQFVADLKKTATLVGKLEQAALLHDKKNAGEQIGFSISRSEKDTESFVEFFQPSEVRAFIDKKWQRCLEQVLCKTS